MRESAPDTTAPAADAPASLQSHASRTHWIEVLRQSLEPSQFRSWAFTRRAVESGLLPSMGSIGDCNDNAVIESFWSRMQVELLDRRRWKTRRELANAIIDYIEIFDNRQRRHSALVMRVPVEFENTPSEPITAARQSKIAPLPNPGHLKAYTRPAALQYRIAFSKGR